MLWFVALRFLFGESFAVVAQIPVPAGEIYGNQSERVFYLQHSALKETYFSMFGNLFAVVIILIG